MEARPLLLCPCILVLPLLPTSCQSVEEPTTVLTQQQWRQVQENILDEEPTPRYKTRAVFADKLELIGFDVSEPVTSGEEVTFTWYWRCKQSVQKNWQIFVHFDSEVRPFRQNLDHHAIDGLYQTSRWQPGQIIRDVQKVTLRADYPFGQARPYIGFFRGTERMPITNDAPKTDDGRLRGPVVNISRADDAAPSRGAVGEPGPRSPRYVSRQIPGAAFAIDGKLDEPAWSSAKSMRLAGFSRDANKLTEVRITHTDEALYIGAFLADDHIWGTFTERDADTWTQEVLEVFLDVDGDGADYLEVQVTPRNVIFDANFPQRLGTEGLGSRAEQIDAARAWNMEGLETAVVVQGSVNDNSDTDTSWTLELKLPYASIPGAAGKPQPGDSWALNIYRFDRPDEERGVGYAWTTAVRGDFHQVDKFGRLAFAQPELPPVDSTQTNTPNPEVRLLPEGIDPSQLKMRRPKSKYRCAPAHPVLEYGGMKVVGR
ncbi:MAG: carbohydrate-binding family 9-like protein [Myxococcota bacterium]